MWTTGKYDGVLESYESLLHRFSISVQVLVDCLKVNRPDLKALFFSGDTDNTIVHHGVLGLGVPLLQKPFSKEDLARKLKEVVAR